METAQTTVQGLIVAGRSDDYIFGVLRDTQDFYESAVLKKWTPLFATTQTILDIGANLGNHSLYWAKQIQPKQIYAFEPFDISYAYLKQNVENNNLGRIIQPIHMAVGDRTGYALVKDTVEGNLGATSFDYAAKHDNGVAQVTTVDHYVAENGIENIGLVKIDTEGFELKVLNGMRVLLETQQPVVWLEVAHDTFLDAKRMMESHGYVLYDFMQFNMLFLPGGKQTDSLISDDRLMEQMFYYIGRTNLYYGNYNKTKQALKRKQTEYAQALIQCEADMAQQMQLLSEIRRDIQNLQTEVAYLRTENEQYRRKLAKITDTWYGRLALRVWRLLKRVRARLRFRK